MRYVLARNGHNRSEGHEVGWHRLCNIPRTDADELIRCSACRNLEPQLTTQLAASNVSYAQLEDTLNQSVAHYTLWQHLLTLGRICVACSTALLQDFETASNQHAEERIWDSHQKVHQYYRSALAKVLASE